MGDPNLIVAGLFLLAVMLIVGAAFLCRQPRPDLEELAVHKGHSLWPISDPLVAVSPSIYDGPPCWQCKHYSNQVCYVHDTLDAAEAMVMVSDFSCFRARIVPMAASREVASRGHGHVDGSGEAAQLPTPDPSFTQRWIDTK